MSCSHRLCPAEQARAATDGPCARIRKIFVMDGALRRPQPVNDNRPPFSVWRVATMTKLVWLAPLAVLAGVAALLWG